MTLDRPNVERVEVKRAANAPPASTLEADLESARALATLLDSQFEVGGVKFGLDAILGLVPVAGDLVSAAIGLYPVMLARRHKLGRWVVLKMLANLGVDLAAGAVPVIGDAADVVLKAHKRNYELLEKAARKHRSTP